MKKVSQFVMLTVVLLLLGTVHDAAATDHQFESSLRLGLKERAVFPMVQLQELELDQAAYTLEEQLAAQADEDLLLQLVAEERSCSDSEALQIFFAEEYLHCP